MGNIVIVQGELKYTPIREEDIRDEQELNAVLLEVLIERAESLGEVFKIDRNIAYAANGFIGIYYEEDYRTWGMDCIRINRNQDN